jgi:methylase of polypeptide subunit release factors
MDKKQAKELIRQTFAQAFDQDRFHDFTAQLLNHLNDSPERQRRWAGQMIKKAYSDYVNHYERIGTYTDPEGRKLDVLVIHLKKETTLERGRTLLRNFAADYLSTGHGNDKDAVLAAYVTKDETDWRFSFVKLEYALEKDDSGKVKERKELTPARRYSFLVGENEKSHTAQKQFLSLLENDQSDPLLSGIEEAFKIEKVTKEFFEQYKLLFDKTKAALEVRLERDAKACDDFKAKAIETDDFAKKLLGQIVFLYFLQKKGWFGVARDAAWGTGQKDYLRHLFSLKKPEENYFNDVLEALFYDTLAREREGDYAPHFRCKIPFLNGGLFEAMGDYDWVHADLLLPDELFSNREITKDGDTGTGILDVFDRYNFTVNEAEPLETEVAVDPEMLGKVFENLLPENLRHKGGTYYTPRVIVNYMCQQSLINYLAAGSAGVSPTAIPREDIETLITRGEVFREFEANQRANEKNALPEAIRKNARQLDRLLAEITVCDPAIGSGAFPVGMMQEIVKARLTLAAVEGMPEQTVYELKRHAIEHSLYGVDIDPSAIEIARLRLWLSLVVDELEFQRIQPLPNLDYKIMQGNSLLEEFAGVKLFDDHLLAATSQDTEAQKTVIREEIIRKQNQLIELASKKIPSARELKAKFGKEIEQLNRQLNALSAPPTADQADKLFRDLSTDAREKLAELKRLHKDFFEQSSPKKKKELRQKLEQLEWEFMELKLEKSDPALLRELAKHRRDNRKSYFLWKLHFVEVFQAKGGFDVVVANPPYVRQEEIKHLKEALKRSYDTYTGTADLYVYFYEQAVRLLNSTGTLAFITSNKYFRAGYGEKLRTMLSEQTRIDQLIDFGDAPVFDATAYASILILGRKFTDGHEARAWSLPPGEPIHSFEQQFNQHCLVLPQSELKSDGWRLESAKVLLLLEKLRKSGTPLGTYVEGRFYRGIVTGFNEAFIVDCATRDRLIAEDASSAEVLKPYLRGRDVKRWRFDNPDLWLVFIPWHFPLHLDKSIKGVSAKAEREFARKYPAIYRHLSFFKDQLLARNKDETGIRYEWFALQRWGADYWQEFEHPKIIYPDIYVHQSFAWDSQKYYPGNTCYFIPTAEKWLIALLNSKLIEWFYSLISNKVRGGYLRAFSDYMQQVPIAQTSQAQQATITKLVDYLLFLKANTAETESHDQLMVSYFEQIIDALVYELYLPDEIHGVGREFFAPLLAQNLPALDEIKSDKLLALRQIFERLFHKDHVIRQNIFFLDTIESIRIIEGKM